MCLMEESTTKKIIKQIKQSWCIRNVKGWEKFAILNSMYREDFTEMTFEWEFEVGGRTGLHSR